MTKNMPKLRISADLSLPASYAGRSAFIAGTKGSGKSYTAGVIAEELLKNEYHVVVLDPTGVWWGLRHDKDGGPGGYPVIILGGEHADVPLQPGTGEIVADFIVRSGQSVVLDMSGFNSEAEQDRFVESLLNRLYRLKAKSRDNLHIIMDEADLFAPEQERRGQEHLLHACKMIVQKGRSRGLGMTMVSQRPQAIAKAVIEEADIVFVHRMQGVRAVKSMGAWTDLYATKEQAKEFFDSLPKLGNGECWVWSPQFVSEFRRVKIRKKETFDSSYTPEPGERAKKPRNAAAIDKEALAAEFAQAAEEAKANDPKLLKAEVARLQKELQKKPTSVTHTRLDPKDSRTIRVLRAALEEAMNVITKITATGFEGLTVDPEVIKRAVESAAAQIVKAVESKVAARHSEIDRTRKEAARLVEKLKKLLAVDQDVNVEVSVEHQHPYAVKSGSPVIRASSNGRPAAEPTERLTPSEKAVLDATASFPQGADRRRIAVFSGRSHASSSFQGAFPLLVGRGFLVGQGDRFVATEEGKKYANPTLGSSLEDWLQKVTPSEAKILEALATAYPRRLSRPEVAEITGQSEKSSSFHGAFPTLRALGLIEGDDAFKASDTLMGA